MVAGGDNDVGLGVVALDAPRNVCDAGSRVASAGLTENVVGGHVGQLFFHDVSIHLVGNHPDVISCNE